MAIATNVLHATRNIREALRNAKAALKRNGLLVLNETTRKSILATLTLGLVDGWWLYEDENLRFPAHPCSMRKPGATCWARRVSATFILPLKPLRSARG